MAEDLDDTIRQNAQGPARASGDAGSVEHPAQLGQLLAVATGDQQALQDPNAFFCGGPSGSFPGYGSASASRWAANS